MSWLDGFLDAYRLVQVGGVPLAQEQILNFVNGTGVDDPTNRRTNITLAAASGIGGGAPSSTQSGAITLPAGTACIEVDLSSVDATVNLAGISVVGTAYQFDLVGSGGTKSILLYGASILSVTNGAGVVVAATLADPVAIPGAGQSVIIKL